MWPLTITLPTSKEGFIITITDKIGGLLEMTDYFTEKIFPSRKTIDDNITSLNEMLLSFINDKTGFFDSSDK